MTLGDLGERLVGAEHLGVAVHLVLQLLADRRDALGAVRVAQLRRAVAHAAGGVVGQGREVDAS